jgi:ABC-type Fe3+ transport system permease subunit
LSIGLPAVLIALFELLPPLHLVARTLDTGENGWRFLLEFQAPQVVLNTAVLTGAVAVSTLAISVPMLLLAPHDPIRELAP